MVKVIARHDYTDSVWDVWLTSANDIEHARVKADGKYEAIVEACEVFGMSRMAAEKIAREA